MVDSNPVAIEVMRMRLAQPNQAELPLPGETAGNRA
jgi:hypothetical protein